MPFLKGQSGNPKGRDPGSKNKRTIEAEKLLSANITDLDALLGTYLAGTGPVSMAKDFVALEPKDRIYIAERLMQYRFPKMQATKVDIRSDAEVKTMSDTLVTLAKSGDQQASRPADDGEK